MLPTSASIPRSLPMVAFGGAGPVHAYGIARKLGIKRIICPTGAGVTSAIGLLIAPVAVDLSASFPMGVDNWDFDQMRRLLDDLAAQGREVVSAAGVAQEAITNRYTVDMRYVGQGHEITVALPERAVLPREQFLEELHGQFHKLYRELFGRTVAASPSRSSPGGFVPAVARIRSPALIKRQVADALKGKTIGLFQRSWVRTWRRRSTIITSSRSIEPVKGPAIIEQRESTAVVGPSGIAHVDGHGNLVINIL